MPSIPQAIVAGHICLDIIPQLPQDSSTLFVPGKLSLIGPATLSTGGAVSNTGLTLHRLGVSTGLMGKVGDDFLGKVMLDMVGRDDPALASQMIVAPGESSSYTVVVNPPGIDRSFLHFTGTNDTFRASDVPYDRLDGVKLFHFGYPTLMRAFYSDGGSELVSLCKRVKEHGVMVSLDMSFPDPDSDAGRLDWRAVLEKTLPYVDLYLPSFPETLFMLDRPSFNALQARAGSPEITMLANGEMLRDTARQLLDMGVAVAALKLGDQGIYVRACDDAARMKAMGVPEWAGGEVVSPCFKVDVKGTTGAGDSTIAGLLCGLLKGLPLDKAVVMASGVGACCVEQPDALSGIIPWEALEKRIAAGWDRRPVTLDLPGMTYDPARGVWTR